MVHSLPRSRAQAFRVPMSGLPSASSQAFEGSSASTHVIDRLIVPCAGIGSIGFMAVHPASAAPRQRIAALARLNVGAHRGPTARAFPSVVILLAIVLPVEAKEGQG